MLRWPKGVVSCEARVGDWYFELLRAGEHCYGVLSWIARDQRPG